MNSCPPVCHPAVAEDRTHLHPRPGFHSHLTQIGDGRTQAAAVVDRDGEHAGYGSSKGDGPPPCSKHRSPGGRSEINSVMTRIFAVGAIGRDHWPGYR